jgi:hypothetical protein
MTPPEVTFSIASAPDAPPLLRTAATVTPKDLGRVHIAEGLLDIRLLPPGDYAAVLAVNDGARQLGRRVQRFRVEGPAADTGR